MFPMIVFVCDLSITNVIVKKKKKKYKAQSAE